MEGGVRKLILIIFFSLQRLCKARAEARQGTCEWKDAVDTTHRYGDVTRECEGCCVGASCSRKGLGLLPVGLL